MFICIDLIFYRIFIPYSICLSSSLYNDRSCQIKTARNVLCYNCNQNGHIAKYCPLLIKRGDGSSSFALGSRQSDLPSRVLNPPWGGYNPRDCSVFHDRGYHDEREYDDREITPRNYRDQSPPSRYDLPSSYNSYQRSSSDVYRDVRDVRDVRDLYPDPRQDFGRYSLPPSNNPNNPNNQKAENQTNLQNDYGQLILPQHNC